VVDSEGIDPLTGALSREGFSQAIREVFPPAHSGEHALSIVQIVINHLDEIGASIGEAAKDEVVISTVVMLRKHFEPLGGVVCRLADSIFSVVLPAVERADAVNEASVCCGEFENRLQHWVPDTPEIQGMCSISMGVAAVDDDSRGVLSNADLLVKAASQAVVVAKAVPGSTARAFVPRTKAA